MRFLDFFQSVSKGLTGRSDDPKVAALESLPSVDDGWSLLPLTFLNLCTLSPPETLRPCAVRANCKQMAAKKSVYLLLLCPKRLAASSRDCLELLNHQGFQPLAF